MTGFSGGGQLLYWWVFQKPWLLRGAFAACANFAGRGVQDAARPEDGGPPVAIRLGGRDEYNDLVNGKKPGLIEQNDFAETNLKKLGFTRLTRSVIPAAGHESLAPQVFAFVDEVLASK
jgi:hypothetical protein